MSRQPLFALMKTHSCFGLLASRGEGSYRIVVHRDERDGLALLGKACGPAAHVAKGYLQVLQRAWSFQGKQHGRLLMRSCLWTRGLDIARRKEVWPPVRRDGCGLLFPKDFSRQARGLPREREKELFIARTPEGQVHRLTEVIALGLWGKCFSQREKVPRSAGGTTRGEQIRTCGKRLGK